MASVSLLSTFTDLSTYNFKTIKTSALHYGTFTIKAMDNINRISISTFNNFQNIWSYLVFMSVIKLKSNLQRHLK